MANFGKRVLENHDDVFNYNAWDGVTISKELNENADKQMRLNSLHSSNIASKFDENDLKVKSIESWERFYTCHGKNFFKNREWFLREFEELIEEDKGYNILDAGCGVGNVTLPLMRSLRRSKFFCFDCSKVAIDHLKKSPLFDSSRCEAFVADFESDLSHIPKCDFVLLIFTLSALPPTCVSRAVKKLVGLLKPGGYLLFRDYGRYDMVHLRFSPDKCIYDDNVFVRGDGTLATFFTEDYVDNIFTSAGLIKKQLKCDQRLLVNRARKLKMFRVWIQAKYYKPDEQ